MSKQILNRQDISIRVVFLEQFSTGSGDSLTSYPVSSYRHRSSSFACLVGMVWWGNVGIFVGSSVFWASWKSDWESQKSPLKFLVCHQSPFTQESRYISAYPSYSDSTQLQLHYYRIVAVSQLSSGSCRVRSAFCRSFTSAPPWCEDELEAVPVLGLSEIYVQCSGTRE